MPAIFWSRARAFLLRSSAVSGWRRRSICVVTL
jgi:hypothetical protein